MAGSPPNLHTMDSRSACIQGVLKVKVKVKSHVIRALLCCHENRSFSHANHRNKASSVQSNISSISVTFARWKHHWGRSLLSTIALFSIKRVFHVFLNFQRFLFKKTLNSHCENSCNLKYFYAKTLKNQSSVHKIIASFVFRFTYF